MTEASRKFPALLDAVEQQGILSEAEQLWSDLQQNNLGGFSGINRPFYILAEFKRVIEKYGNRDVGLTWSKDDLDAARLAGKRENTIRLELTEQQAADLLDMLEEIPLVLYGYEKEADALEALLRAALPPPEAAKPPE